MDKQTLAKRIFEKSYLRGEFRLRSGQISHEYFDKYRFESDPTLLSAISEHMMALLPKQDHLMLAGLELGGIPLATALSLKTGLPALFVRKKVKDYGTCKIVEGAESIQGKTLVVVEDVITTGGQVLESVEALRAEGALIDTVICVILRGDPSKLEAAGLKVRYLFSMDELKN
jgi:orotate phosphoribosyltransferase